MTSVLYKYLMVPRRGTIHKITFSKYRHLRGYCVSFVFLLTEICVPESWLPEWPKSGHLGGVLSGGHRWGALGT